MRNRPDFDSRHSRAIVREVGARLRAELDVDRELPADIKMQLKRLRQFEEQAPLIVPSVEQRNKLR